MSRFAVKVLGRCSVIRAAIRTDGEGFALWADGVKVAYSLSENALSDWALYSGGASEVAFEFDLREVEDRKDGRR